MWAQDLVIWFIFSFIISALIMTSCNQFLFLAALYFLFLKGIDHLFAGLKWLFIFLEAIDLFSQLFFYSLT